MSKITSLNSEKKQQKSKERMTSLNTAKRGNMQYRTCFSSVSYHGYKLDVLKSGMQKYLRRREFEKMTWCVMEIFKFEVCSETELEKKMCKGIISNLLNRIIVMMDEELLFCEVQNYLLLRKFIEMFESDRKNGGKFLVLICRTLANSRLLRRASDIRAFWDFRIRNEKEAVELSDEEYFNKFVECFEKKDDECFKWMFKIFNGKKKGDVVRFRRKDNIYMIWEYLFSRENVKGNGKYKELLEYKLREFYKLNRGERFMFLANSIDLVMKCDGKESIYVNVYISQICQELSRYEQDFVEMYKKNMEYLQIDDYAIDMHTSEGRKRGKNRKDFALEGCLVVREDTEFLVKEWRDFYIKEKLDNPVRSKKKRWEGKKKVEKKVEEKKVEEKKDIKKAADILVSIKNMGAEKKGKTDRAKLRAEKYKRIKKMRGKPNFDDLEKNLEFIDGQNIDINYIKLCSDMTCGNKVMCFEFVSSSWGVPNTVWKESRKSMNYNRDYCVLDECKKLFGLEKIGMKRVLSNFRIEKIDKNIKCWINNWKKVYFENEKVVYCVMDKIEPGIEIGKAKEMLKDRKILKEFVKIGVFRGIFRVSDFNGRNVLIKDENKLVSIDEGDIGKRLDILGGSGKHKWLIKALNADKTIIKEILSELISVELPLVKSIPIIVEKMKKYKFGDELIKEVCGNFKNLKRDLESEGVEF